MYNSYRRFKPEDKNNSEKIGTMYVNRFIDILYFKINFLAIIDIPKFPRNMLNEKLIISEYRLKKGKSNKRRILGLVAIEPPLTLA
jgi:hypothetical protein